MEKQNRPEYSHLTTTTEGPEQGGQVVPDA